MMTQDRYQGGHHKTLKSLMEYIHAIEESLKVKAKINYLPNPRNEAVENDLIVDNRCFIELGLDPTTLDNGLLEEVVNVAKKFSNRCDLKRIPCVSAWTSTQAKAIHKS